MDKAQIIAEFQKRLPDHSPQEIEEGILEFAKEHPGMEPEEALQALDSIISESGVPKPSRGLVKYLEED